jgi:hypothetical protein
MTRRQSLERRKTVAMMMTVLRCMEAIVTMTVMTWRRMTTK